MNDRDDPDPPYILNLMNQESSFNSYFVVGDPKLGPVERIGVVAAMLMAHSMVLRRAMSVQDTEQDERWDITLTDIQPNVFKNVLKFIYAYNQIKSYSILETLEMLRVADRLEMQPLLLESTSHIMELLNPATVCLALSHSIVLGVSRLEQHIAKIVRDDTRAVLDSATLHHLSPAGMKYIVQQDRLQVSWAEVWRGVIKWARTKVLKQQSPSDPSILERFIRSRLIVPSKAHAETCCLTAIQLVEEVLEGGSASSAALLLNYHLVPASQPQRLFICTGCWDSCSVRHEEMDVKPIQDCSLWAEPVLKTSSELNIHTSNAIVELHSIVCSGKRTFEEEELIKRSVQKDELAEYLCIGSVDVVLVSTDVELSVANIPITEKVTLNEEFEIVLLSDNQKIKLLPHSTYRITTRFIKPHPLWYTDDTDDSIPESCNGFDVRCGVVNKAKLWKGSHARYIIYRTISG